MNQNDLYEILGREMASLNSRSRTWTVDWEPLRNAAHTPSHRARLRPRRLNLLVRALGLTMREISDAANRSISRSQIWLVLRGLRRPTPFEQKAIGMGIVRCLQKRIASGSFFEER